MSSSANPETLNFGPEWIRNLSGQGAASPSTTNNQTANSSTTNSSISHRPSPTKFRLAEFRYGREEMLMLYTTEEKTPETLQAVPHIISNSTVYPIALTPLTAEDQVTSINSDLAYKGRGVPISGRGIRGRGRGKGRGTAEYSRSVSQSDESYLRGTNRDYARRFDSRHFDDPPIARNKSIRRSDTSGNWRDDAMRAGGDGGEGRPSNWREGSGRVSLWRESNTDGYRGASRHPHVRRSASTSSKLDTGGSELPEWAADEVGSELGVFDASGAFQTRSGTEVEKKKPENEEKPSGRHLMNSNALQKISEKETTDTKPTSPTENQPSTSPLPNVPPVPTHSSPPPTLPTTATETTSSVAMTSNNNVEDVVMSKEQQWEERMRLLSLSNGQRDDQLETEEAIPIHLEEAAIRLVESEVEDQASRDLNHLQQQHNYQQQQQAHLDQMHFPQPQQQTIKAILQQQPTDEWYYRDPQGEVQGPFPPQQMSEWLNAGYFSKSLNVRRANEATFQPLGKLFERYGSGLFCSPMIHPMVQEQINQQLLEQEKLRQEKLRQEIALRNFVQQSKEANDRKMQTFQNMILNSMSNNVEFRAMTPANKQLAIANHLNVYQQQLENHHQIRLSSFLARNSPVVPTANVCIPPSTNANASAISTSAALLQDSSSPWEVDPAIVRRPMGGATQQEQQHFMQLLKKKTAEQELRAAQKMREDMEMEEKRKIELQLKQDEVMRKNDGMRQQILQRMQIQQDKMKQDQIQQELIKQELLKEDEKLKQIQKDEELKKKVEEEQMKQKLIQEEQIKQKLIEEEQMKQKLIEEEQMKQKLKEDQMKQALIKQEQKKLKEEQKKQELMQLSFGHSTKQSAEAAERRRADEDRVRMEAMLKAEEEQRLSNARRKEEEEERRRRKREEEEEWHRRQAEEKRKMQEEELQRKQREQMIKEQKRKKEMEELKQLNLPPTAQWAKVTNATMTSSKPQPTVAEIQRLEEEREREREMKMRRDKEIKAAQKQQQRAASVWGGNSARLLAGNQRPAPSLVEIQREEADRCRAANAVVDDNRPQKPTSAKAALLANSGNKWNKRVTAASTVAMTTNSAVTKRRTVTSPPVSKSAWGVVGQTRATPLVWEKPPEQDTKNFQKVFASSRLSCDKR